MEKAQELGAFIICTSISILVLFVGVLALLYGSRRQRKGIGVVLMIISIFDTIIVALAVFNVFYLLDNQTLTLSPIDKIISILCLLPFIAYLIAGYTIGIKLLL